ncbi:MAG: hypothetical protein N2651_10385 [Fimbriimonadales bacterium]|nr:hypothetical protein [Fimbriimonadales bacterium]
MARSANHDNQAHLSAEQILELAERGRRCRRYNEYIDHVAECAVCRETYKQLLTAEQAARVAQRPAWAPVLRFWLPVAAAATLILFFGGRALLSGGSESVALRQENGTWYEGATRLPEWAFASAARFERPPSALRSIPEGTSAPIRLLNPRPANAALESFTPEFRWERVPDAVRYRARLERADGTRSFSLKVEGERASLPEGVSLEAGVEYRLTIEALAGAELAGDGLKSVYEFRTLTPAEQEQLRWARANRSHAPRVCAVIFYQLGFYADALETLNTLPDEPQVKQWRAAAQEQIRARSGRE